MGTPSKEGDLKKSIEVELELEARLEEQLEKRIELYLEKSRTPLVIDGKRIARKGNIGKVRAMREQYAYEKDVRELRNREARGDFSHMSQDLWNLYHTLKLDDPELDASGFG
jgi:hypothetical protein